MASDLLALDLWMGAAAAWRQRSVSDSPSPPSHRISGDGAAFYAFPL